MKKRAMFAALLVPAILACATTFTRAGETTIGVTLNGTIGTHSEAVGGSATLPLIPVPIFRIEHREGRFSLFLEGLPPIGPIGYVNPAPGTASGTKIGMLDGALRYALPSRRAWIGMGETVINQTTTYAPILASFPAGSYTVNLVADGVDASRVVGARYEIGANLLTRGSQRLDLSVAASPSMHARLAQTGTVSSSSDEPGFVPRTTIRFTTTAETASLVDAHAGWSVIRGRSTFSAGLRYLNYAAKFDDGTEADRNRVLLPFVGWSTKL